MKKQGKDAPRQSGTVDASRRKLLGQMSKVAYVAPTLTLLSFTASAQDTPPPTPSVPFPTKDGRPGTTSNRNPRRRNGSD